MAKAVRISLANKCQLLFGAAVVLILTAALAVGWLRMQTLVIEGQKDIARKLANACIQGAIQPGKALMLSERGPGPVAQKGLMLNRLEKDDLEIEARGDKFLDDAVQQFQTHTSQRELFRPAEDPSGQRYYRYARAVRKSDLARVRGGEASAALDIAPIADPLEGVVLVQMPAEVAQRQLLLNAIYIVAAGLFAGLVAIGAFWFITTRLILSPVRVLRNTAQKVSEGDLNIRSDINTGDEFEELSESFNLMLATLKKHQDQLSSINKSLDLKLGELAQSNMSLYEANKIKGEFLANVSHELRTPLNSIIGFAEVLEETIKESAAPIDEKRRRYVGNIIISSRRLLDLINELLDLTKIEAGRMQVRVGPMSVADTVEGLVNLMRPQAEKKEIRLDLQLAPNIPVVQTDAGKFHQILFNFLSNAIKFTPASGTVTISTELVVPTGTGPAAPTAEPSTPTGTDATPPAFAPPSRPEAQPRVRVSVTDTGPGIPVEEHERIFEKFTQLDSTVTKGHGGSGLGLAISKELARLLRGEVELDSDTGKGAIFSLVIPLTLERSVPLMPELMDGPVAQPAAAAGTRP